MQGDKTCAPGNELGLLLACHQIEVLGRVALDTAHQLDLVVLLPRIETFNELLEPLGTFFVKLMRQLDIGRRGKRRERSRARKSQRQRGRESFQ